MKMYSILISNDSPRFIRLCGRTINSHEILSVEKIQDAISAERQDRSDNSLPGPIEKTSNTHPFSIMVRMRDYKQSLIIKIVLEEERDIILEKIDAILNVIDIENL